MWSRPTEWKWCGKMLSMEVALVLVKSCLWPHRLATELVSDMSSLDKRLYGRCKETAKAMNLSAVLG